MGRIWTKGFWKDAVERVGSTFLETLLGSMIAAGGFAAMGVWNFWESVLWITVIALGKTIVAGLANPTTGASFGTSVPADGVVALKTADEQVSAGPGSPLEDGTPVQVDRVPGV